MNNCLICNKEIDNFENIQLCKDCDNTLFNVLRDYLNRNPNAHTSDIYVNTKIPLILIKKYLDDPRFEIIGKRLKETNDICFYCGKEILYGKIYCNTCLNNLKLIENYKKNDRDYFENSSKTYVKSGTYKHLKIKKQQ